MENVCFLIAEQRLKLSLPGGVDWRNLLPSFVGFVDRKYRKRKSVCKLGVSTDRIMVNLSAGTLLTEFSQILGEHLQLYEVNDLYVVNLQILPTGESYRMICNHDFTEAYAYIGRPGQLCGEALNAFLMMVFAQSCVLHHTFLIHASVVMKQGKGYAFLGKSGTGKSTHSSLWLQYIGGVELLNDDNPAISVTENGTVYIYGTPWSGKTPCYKNKKAELAALVRLHQAPENHFSWKTGVDALVTLLPGCSSMRWDDYLFGALCNLLEEVTQKTPVACLHCLPDEAAARLCYNEIIKNNK